MCMDDDGGKVVAGGGAKDGSWRDDGGKVVVAAHSESFSFRSAIGFHLTKLDFYRTISSLHLPT